MRRHLLATAIVPALMALGAPAAQASYDPLASGTGTFALDASFKRLLAKNGIAIQARLPGKRRPAASAAGRLTLPVAGGKADPTIKKAEIDLGGELLLKRGRLRLPLRAITLRTKPTPIFAKVGGGQLKVAKAASVSLPREGFGNRLLASGLKLTAKAATRFNKRLRTDAFAEGQKLGSLRATSQPVTLAVLPVGRATLEFAPAIYAKLNALSTSVNPIFPAEHAGPTFTYPIAVEGEIAPDAAGGVLRLAGGTELLRLGFGQIFWNEFWLDLAGHAATAELDLEPTPKFPGRLGRTPVLSLGAGTLNADPAARTVTLAGAPLTLTADSAAQLNAAFAEGKAEFAPGELLGTLTFTAQTQ